MWDSQKIGFIWINMLFAYCLGAQSVDAVSISEDNSKAFDAKGMLVEHFSTSNGLLQNTVKEIAMDQNHLIWVFSERGISSFDGKTFSHFSGKEFYGKRLAMSEDGMLMAERFFIENGKVHIRDWRDSIYIASGAYIGLRTNPDYMARDSTMIRVIRQTIPGKYYTQHKNGLMYYQKGRGKTLLLGSDDFIDKYFIHQQRFYNINLVKGEIKVFKNQHHIQTLKSKVFSEMESLLWCHKSEAYYLYGKDRIHKLAFTSNGDLSLELILENLSIKSIISLMVDEENNRFYLGTTNTGLYVLKPKQFQSRFDPLLGSWNNTYSQVEVGRDSVLTGMGLLFTPTEIKKVMSRSRFKGLTLLKNGKGEIWSSQLEFSNGNSSELILENVNKPIHVLGETENLNINQGLEGKILYKSISSSAIRNANGDTLYQSKDFEDKSFTHYDTIKNKYWFIQSGVFWIYDPTDSSFISIDEQSHLLFRFNYSLNEEIDIIAFKEWGLKAYYKGSWLDLPLDENSYLAFPNCITEDDNGFLWISTNNGLFQLSKEELVAFVTNGGEDLYYHWFGEGDGVENVELNGGCEPCALQLQSGKFSFPALNGILQFDPLRVKTSQHYSDILVRSVRLDGQESEITSGAVISQDMNKLEFFISIPFYGSPTNNSYVEYKLVGLSDTWYRLPEDQLISFSTLKYGKYELVIRKKMGFGINNYAYQKFSLRVERFYYQTWWFRALILLFCLFSVWITFRIKNRISNRIRNRMQEIIQDKTKAYQLLNEKLKLNNAQLRASEVDLKKNVKIREKLIELYAHQIRGPLKFMGDAAERNKDHVEKMNAAELRKWFSAIADTSNNIYRQTERMFSVVLTDQKELNVKRTPIVLKSFIDKLLLELERELKSKKVVFKTNILEDLVCYEDYNMLVIIFNNIMMNAIQHTQKGRINVEAHEVNDKVVLIVEDTGKGIAKDRVDQLNAGTYQPKEGKAFGLKISKMLLDEMDAYLQIESEERVGTTVSVFLSKNIENIGM